MSWLNCADCKERFALDDATEAALRRSQQGFVCPWGHSNYFPKGQSETDKLRAQLQAQEQAAAKARADAERERKWRCEAEDARQHTERRLAAQRGVTTRLKNRVAKGVCPCCNRTFINLQRHMSTKHAGFLTEEVQGETGNAVH